MLCKLNRTSEAQDLLEGILREAEMEDRPQAQVKIVFPLETVMTLTKATEASSDKVQPQLTPSNLNWLQWRSRYRISPVFKW